MLYNVLYDMPTQYYATLRQSDEAVKAYKGQWLHGSYKRLLHFCIALAHTVSYNGTQTVRNCTQP